MHSVGLLVGVLDRLALTARLYQDWDFYFPAAGVYRVCGL